MPKIVPEKRCPKCGKVKPSNLFYKYAKRKDGFTTYCIDCYGLIGAMRSEKQRERKRKQAREFYCKDIEVSRAKSREKVRRYTERNRDKINERQKQYAADNPERRKEYQRRYYEKHPEQKQRNKDRLKKFFSVTDKNREYKANRRAQKLKAGGVYTAKEFKELCNKYHNLCLCCSSKERLVADHVMPLALGGSNDIGNIQPLCFSCNAKKHTKYIDYRP
jgi:5-methylcytosine-specific restriction endonuclease McrA